MSSSDSEVPFSTIRADLPIPELIKSIKHSFREYEFDEVRDILMDREKNMKNEIENLEGDRDLIREEVCLLERTQSLAELEKLKFEEKLQMSERECGELREKVTRLIEDQRLSCDREKRAQDRYAEVCEEHSKLASEKSKIILELNVKINELKNQKKEGSDLKVVELRLENLEAMQTIEELKRQKLEAENAAQFHKNRFENLAPRITKAEEAIASMLKLKVDDIANLVNDVEKYAAAEEDENVNFLYCEGGKDSLGNSIAQGVRNADFGKKGVKLSGVSSTSNSTGYGYSGLSKKGCSSKMVGSSAAGRDLIEISDSDDEINPAGATYIPDICADVGKKEIVCEKSPSSHLNKRNGTDCTESSFISLSPKRKCGGLPPTSYPVFKCESQTPSQEFNGFNDESFRDLKDESCSETYMENFVATMLSQNCRKWKYGADLLNAFQEDTELCMNAVCALYRQNSKGGGFSHFDAMSGHTLAKYLTDGDPELRLRKSVSDVKQENPDVISQCKKLASRYYVKLFDIYCNAEDPFFGQT